MAKQLKSTNIEPARLDGNVICGSRIESWISKLKISPLAKVKLQEAFARTKQLPGVWFSLQPSPNSDAFTSTCVGTRELRPNTHSHDNATLQPDLDRVRAGIEVAVRLDALSPSAQRWLLEELDSVSSVNDEKPTWDPSHGILKYRACRVEFVRRATNQRLVLNRYQQNGWPPEIRNPFDSPTIIDETTIHATVRDLNAKVKRVGLLFRAEKGRVFWSAQTCIVLQSNLQ